MYRRCNPRSHFPQPPIIQSSRSNSKNLHLQKLIRTKTPTNSRTDRKKEEKGNNGLPRRFRVPPQRPEGLPTAPHRKRERLPRRRLLVREQGFLCADFRGLLPIGERLVENWKNITFERDQTPKSSLARSNKTRDTFFWSMADGHEHDFFADEFRLFRHASCLRVHLPRDEDYCRREL